MRPWALNDSVNPVEECGQWTQHGGNETDSERASGSVDRLKRKWLQPDRLNEEVGLNWFLSIVSTLTSVTASVAVSSPCTLPLVTVFITVLRKLFPILNTTALNLQST